MKAEGKGSSPLLLLPAVAVLAFLFVYPLATTVWTSLRTPGGLGLDNYVSFLTRYGGLGTLALTSVLALSATAISIVSSLLLLVLVPRRGRWRTAALTAILVPVVVPGLIFALGLLLLWDETGWVNLVLTRSGVLERPLDVNYTRAGLVLFYAWLYFPFTAMAVFSRWESIPGELVEAARVCGAGRVETARRVVLPLLRPGIIAGASMTFMLSFGAFSVPLVCGGDIVPIAVEIYRRTVVFGDWGTGSAAAVTMAGVQLVLLAVIAGKLAGRWKP